MSPEEPKPGHAVKSVTKAAGVGLKLREESGVQPIFVVGLPRTGTTLTAQILGRHASILAPGETHYFEELSAGIKPDRQEPLDLDELAENAGRLYTSLGRHRNKRPQQILQTQFSEGDLLARSRALGLTVGAVYRAFIELQSQGSTGERYVCDDTPRHLFLLPSILGWFPRAKVIACVRDPRDFMCSYKNYWKRATGHERARMRRLYHPLLTSSYWRSGMNLLKGNQERLDRSTLVSIRYEDLVGDPEPTVRGLCEFLDVDFDPNMLAVERSNSSFEVSGSGILTQSVGRWRSCLEPHEVWLTQWVNASTMAGLHYDLAPVRLPWPSLVLAFASTPIAALRAVWANRARTESLADFLLRRVRGILAR